MIVQHVRQEDEYGCGIAALAMILGKTYGEVKAMFPAIDNSVRGLHVDDVLADFGYATAVKYRFRRMWDATGEQVERSPWPPEPFAELHLCNVYVSKSSPCAHWVVMLADGSVFDPLTSDRRQLTDYHQVNNVAAVISFPQTAETP